MNPISQWRRRRRDEAALIRSHSLLVDEALAAQKAGASTAVVATIVTGAHRSTVQGSCDRLDLPRSAASGRSRKSIDQG